MKEADTVLCWISEVWKMLDEASVLVCENVAWSRKCQRREDFHESKVVNQRNHGEKGPRF